MIGSSADEVERLRAEVRQLRSLIAAWAEADDKWRSSRKSRGSELGVRLTDAEAALRKAVGR